MCYFHALFQHSKQFHSDITINSILECRNTFKLSTCLMCVLNACYGNSVGQCKIFYSYRMDTKNDKDRDAHPNCAFSYYVEEGGQSRERRKSVPVLTEHCHYNPYSPRAFTSL